MSTFFRRRVEATIEHMIILLDHMDGDPDLEQEPVEEQHDREPDHAPLTLACMFAERAKRKRRS